MNLRRWGVVARFELNQSMRRPLVWVWGVTVFLTSTVAAAGVFKIKSGADMAGGIQAHLTSSFAVSYELALVVGIVYPLFVAVLAGMGVLKDGEIGVEPLIHSTALRPTEYVWGKFSSAVAVSLAVLGVQLLASMVFKHGLTAAGRPELIGSFSPANYLFPALFVAVPLIVFTAGVCFAVGESTRNPILVNLVSLVLVLGCVFVLWTWSPAWLDPRWNRALMLLDPTGFRWLKETWILVDRGAEFYNTQRVALDPPFLLSRLALMAAGLLGVVFSQRHLAGTIRGRRVAAGDAQLALEAAGRPEPLSAAVDSRLADLGMTSRRPSFIRSALEIARVEILVVGRHPALWILIPLVVLNATFDAIYAVGPFDTPLLLTPGGSAVGSLVELTFTLCLLVMFYTVESFRREHATKVGTISFATPVRTSALILGKALASSVVGFATLLAVFLTCAVLLMIQGTVPLDPIPYLVVYGLLLGPTVFVFSAFVGLIYSLTGGRGSTYAISIGAMIASAILLAMKKMSWVWNWSLAGALRWSDLAPFELSRTPLILNRILMLAVALLLIAITIRVFPRRRFDSGRTTDRLRPASLMRTAWRMSPLILIPFVLGLTLHKGINRGPQGKRVERWVKSYWQRNHATWLEAPLPDVTRTDVDLELEPDRRWFQTRGTFELTNNTGQPLTRIPITGGPHWEELTWTIDGVPAVPENREGLYVFSQDPALAQGESCVLGFSFEGTFLAGFTKNGDESWEFILPSGVVLTSSWPAVVPVVGYLESMGIDDDNRYDAREYPDDYHEGVTGARFGSDVSQRTKIRITAPERYTMNSVGVLTDSVVADGRRTVTWESDFPVDSFNVAST